jgi:hypothetical protein
MATVNIYEMAQTWNNGAVAFTAIGMNVTDTASDAASLLMDLQVGGASKFSINKDGRVSFTNGSGIAETFANYLSLFVGNTEAFRITPSAGELRLGGMRIGFGSALGTQDLIVTRDAANTLAQRNGANAQAFNIYNTYTDASNYERGFMRWNGNLLEIGTEALGTGTARAVRLGVGTARKIEIPTIGGWQLYNGTTREGYLNWDAFAVRSDTFIGWASSTAVGAGQGDTNLIRSAAAVVGVRANNATTGGSVEFLEQTAPAAGSATSARIFAQDNGSGKTQLMVQFGSGAAQQIAIEP